MQFRISKCHKGFNFPWSCIYKLDDEKFKGSENAFQDIQQKFRIDLCLSQLWVAMFMVHHKTLPPIDFIDLLLTISCKIQNLDPENKSLGILQKSIYIVLLP